jgi:hypothetical protein
MHVFRTAALLLGPSMDPWPSPGLFLPIQSSCQPCAMRKVHFEQIDMEIIEPAAKTQASLPRRQTLTLYALHNN